MDLFETTNNIPNDAKGGVIAIGNFDGVHKGHQALIKKAKKIGKEKNIPVGVLTFEPHPRQLFQPDQPPARLTPHILKRERLETHELDFALSLPFDWDFASQSAEDFVQKILIQGLNASHVVIGYDFKFGQLRKGSAETIQKAGIAVDTVSAVKDEKGENISSSRIRQLLRAGDIDETNALLGWEWKIHGKVFRGDRRGHELGYPTANILMKEIIHPAYGVYACKVKIEGEETWLNAATNIGIRPMFEVPEGQVEAHILDFPDRDIYDKILHVKPIKRLRGEAKFNAIDDLIAQMEKDCAQAREILS
jgi:riboflavin kinase/FMN adenylyltransferase